MQVQVLPDQMGVLNFLEGRLKMSTAPLSERPDPGEGFRLVDQETELPRPDAEIWLPGSKRWADRLNPNNPWVSRAFYRVPSEPVPEPVSEPVPLRWPDIPVSDDAWFQPEPDLGGNGDKNGGFIQLIEESLLFCAYFLVFCGTFLFGVFARNGQWMNAFHVLAMALLALLIARNNWEGGSGE